MRTFQNTFKTRKRSFISAFSIYMTDCAFKKKQVFFTWGSDEYFYGEIRTLVFHD